MKPLTAMKDTFYFIGMTALIYGACILSDYLFSIGQPDVTGILVIALFSWLEWKFQNHSITAHVDINNIEDARRYFDQIRNRN